MGCLKLPYQQEKEPLLKCAWNSGRQQKSCVRMYDFGKRMYMPDLGRWFVIDPVSDILPNWTPYRYAFNNPINIIDIGGYIEWPIKGNTAVNKKDVPNGGWGLKNTVVRTSVFKSTDRPKGASNPHIGIDYRAAVGTDFYSLGDGTVTSMGIFKSGAKYIEVQYGNGDKVRFIHINSTSSGLEVGSRVKEGQILGQTGETGCEGSPHLHIDATRDGAKVDPEEINYGTVTNKEFFETYGGDYNKLSDAKNNTAAKDLKARKTTIKANGKKAQGIKYDLSDFSSKTKLEILGDIIRDLLKINNNEEKK